MNSCRRFNLVVGLACALGALVPATGMGADGDAPPRPGQLRGVLAALKTDGEPLARQGTSWLLKREYLVQLLHLTTDPRGGMAGGGWYQPSQARYGWEWLKQRDRDGDGTITLAEFAGPREWYEALDKNRDGVLTKDDFDWGTGTALATANTKARALLDRIDRDANGQITAQEWNLWFDALAAGKGYVSQDDLVPLFLEKRPAPVKAPAPKPRLAIVCSYISGDVGSLSEGPNVGETAPHFSLLTTDGKNKFSLSKNREPKPLVLIFGSFT